MIQGASAGNGAFGVVILLIRDRSCGAGAITTVAFDITCGQLFFSSFEQRPVY